MGDFHPNVWAPNAGYSQPTEDELDHRFRYHPPSREQAECNHGIRTEVCCLAKYLARVTKPSPEQQKMFDHLDQVMFLAHASIARNP